MTTYLKNYMFVFCIAVIVAIAGMYQLKLIGDLQLLVLFPVVWVLTALAGIFKFN